MKFHLAATVSDMSIACCFTCNDQGKQISIWIVSDMSIVCCFTCNDKGKQISIWI